MTKYDRLKEPLRKAKANANLVEDLIRSNEKRLEDAYKRKQRYNVQDRELYQFGYDLYVTGYKLDDFVASINACVESNFKTPEEIKNTGWFNYENIEHVPSFEKIAKIVKDPNYMFSIKNGYNFGYRKELIEKNTGMSR